MGPSIANPKEPNRSTSATSVMVLMFPWGAVSAGRVRNRSLQRLPAGALPLAK